MSKKLVFIHGRAQQRKDAKALKQEWIASFREGLSKNGLTIPIREEDIRFPYYGDTLDQLSSGRNPADAAGVIIRGAESKAEEEFIRDVLAEVKAKTGITDEEVLAELDPAVVEKGPLNWGWVQAILKVIDRKVPFGSGTSVALVTKDVYDYLTKPAVRQVINKGVRAAVTGDEATVIVSHSLGTVVAYNILREAGETDGWNVPLFVTLGSPLGVTRIRDGIKPTVFPPCVKRWFNAMDERDVVALYPLESPHFVVDPKILNKTNVNNHTENRHGIAGYLDDAEVAKCIYKALEVD